MQQCSKKKVFFLKKGLQTSLLNKKAFKLNAISKNVSNFFEQVWTLKKNCSFWKLKIHPGRLFHPGRLLDNSESSILDAYSILNVYSHN